MAIPVYSDVEFHGKNIDLKNADGVSVVNENKIDINGVVIKPEQTNGDGSVTQGSVETKSKVKIENTVIVDGRLEVSAYNPDYGKGFNGIKMGNIIGYWGHGNELRFYNTLTDEKEQLHLFYEGDFNGLVIDNGTGGSGIGQGTLQAGAITANNFYANSDARKKENIIPLISDNNITSLRIYKYNFISDNTKQTHIGCLAQELQQICPELVKEDSEGFLSVDNNGLIYVLLNYVKTLEKRIVDLENMRE